MSDIEEFLRRRKENGEKHVLYKKMPKKKIQLIKLCNNCNEEHDERWSKQKSFHYCYKGKTCLCCRSEFINAIKKDKFILDSKPYRNIVNQYM
jgi:hypothetical protein